MSFILDALRKSEQMRLSQSGAPLLSASGPEPVHRSPPRLLIVLAALLLLTTGVALGLLYPVTHPEPAQSPPPLPTSTIITPPPAQTTPSAPSPAPSSPAIAIATASARHAAPHSTTQTATAPIAPAAPLPRLDELPAPLQAQLPKLSIAAHAYSKTPAKRFVFINDRMLHEGDTLMPELRLEQITPDGMIFNYQGQRFEHGLQP
ncbi:MAG: general secretion pathway protein GspB [Sterolibacterium sp.]|jgi:general secretion pathway protein B|nr:general secretion pathway protein GspB [Sterolibacterium sp.]MBP9800012.1 general secretion pathway protein GspB [Sterolibacterium sp.]